MNDIEKIEVEIDLLRKQFKAKELELDNKYTEKANALRSLKETNPEIL